jgi:hypothetical protein
MGRRARKIFTWCACGLLVVVVAEEEEEEEAGAVS